MTKELIKGIQPLLRQPSELASKLILDIPSHPKLNYWNIYPLVCLSWDAPLSRLKASWGPSTWSTGQHALANA